MFHLGAALLQNLAVSPELTLRPSLSVLGVGKLGGGAAGVAGANVGKHRKMPDAAD